MFRHIITIPLFLQVVTGLLIAEVNVNTMCELGSGGVSLVSSFFHIEKKKQILRCSLLVYRADSIHFPSALIIQVSMAMRTIGTVGVQIAR